MCDPDGKIWIFGFSLGVCSTELRNLVSSLEYLVSNGRQVLLGGIRLGGFGTTTGSTIIHSVQIPLLRVQIGGLYHYYKSMWTIKKRINKSKAKRVL